MALLPTNNVWQRGWMYCMYVMIRLCYFKLFKGIVCLFPLLALRKQAATLGEPHVIRKFRQLLRAEGGLWPTASKKQKPSVLHSQEQNSANNLSGLRGRSFHSEASDETTALAFITALQNLNQKTQLNCSDSSPTKKP